MKSKQSARWVSLALVLTLLLTLFAACTGDSSGSASPASSEGSSSAASETASEGSGEASADQPIESISDNELYEFSIFGANMGTELKEADQAYIKGLEDKLNLKLDVEIPPSSSYVESLQMMLASGDYAELFLIPDDQTKIRSDIVRDGVVIPVNDLIANAPNLMAYTYDISWEMLRLAGDDNIYGIPRTSIARADGFMLRKDWLDAVGITYVEEGKPLTLEQIEEIATLFTFNDPDGNGANDTYGIASNATPEGNIDLIYGPAFGLTGWKEYDGAPMDPKFSREDDSYKNALTWHQDVSDRAKRNYFLSM
ncbi:MAG: extracellular solute-binding protein [Oscillospiraceae bacterium]